MKYSKKFSRRKWCLSLAQAELRSIIFASTIVTKIFDYDINDKLIFARSDFDEKFSGKAMRIIQYHIEIAVMIHGNIIRAMISIPTTIDGVASTDEVRVIHIEDPKTAMATPIYFYSSQDGTHFRIHETSRSTIEKFRKNVAGLGE